MSAGTLTPSETRISGDYIEQVMAQVKAKNPAEPEFHQAVQEVFDSLRLVLQRHPEYREARILERVVALQLETGLFGAAVDSAARLRELPIMPMYLMARFFRSRSLLVLATLSTRSCPFSPPCVAKTNRTLSFILVGLSP